MKCLIDCWTWAVTWPEELMPDISPFMLKIVNKPLLEYYVDFCVRQQITELRVALRSPARDLQEYFQDGSRWGIAITYAMARPDDSLEEIITHNQTFIGKERLMLLRGLFFLHYGEQSEEWHFPDFPEGWALKSHGSIIMAQLPENGEMSGLHEYQFGAAELPLTPIATVKDYFDLNMQIMRHHSGRYVLPGYNNEDGVFLGQNVEISRSCNITCPVMIADNVQMKAITTVGPGAIIGSNVIIDRATAVSDAIVCDNSYVGADLEICNKIVYRNHIIDPENGSMVDIVDDFLLTDMSGNHGREMVDSIVQQLQAALLIVLMAIPFLLLRGVVRTNNVRKIIWKDQKLNELSLELPEYPRANIAVNVWRRLSLDKFMLLFMVLRGQLFLAGNRMLDNNDSNATTIRELKRYHPAVFSFVETINDEFLGDEENVIHEFYYSNNAGIAVNIGIVFKVLLRRLFNL